MKRKQYSQEERSRFVGSVDTLKRNNPKMTIAECCEKVGGSQFNYYNWKKSLALVPVGTKAMSRQPNVIRRTKAQVMPQHFTVNAPVEESHIQIISGPTQQVLQALALINMPRRTG